MQRGLIFSFRNAFAGLAAIACFAMGQTAGVPGGRVPMIQVDPAWPQPLPNNWVLGQVCGTATGPQDHVWIIHRPGTTGENRKLAAPPVIEFDAQGKVVRAWGGPGAGYEWPAVNEHGIFVDYEGNVWISGVAGKDYGRILKFTTEGKFLMAIGTPLEEGEMPTNSSTTHLGRQPADMYVDPQAKELYVADGDGGARRVIVFDSNTGAFKRLWGAYGEKPLDGPPVRYDPKAPPARSFSSAVHCVVILNDGLLYVCDRNADRIQIFRKDGTFVKEVFIEPATTGNGTTADIGFTPDQSYLYVPDATNQKISILRKDTMEVVGAVGQPGSGPGQFRNLHSLSSDSKGNIYTGELDGKRVQRFVPVP
jgi:hypothetical protein